MLTSDPVTVHRTAWRVRFIETSDDAEHIPRAFEELEAALPTFRGRKFVGAFDADAGWYRACVKSVDDPHVDEARLPLADIPGGRYLRIRLRDEPPGLYAALPETYERLRSLAEADDQRPSLEVYRRHDEIDLLLPVHGSAL
jgi:hypothetical protein